MENVSFSTYTLIILATLFVVYLLYKALNRSLTFLLFIAVWVLVISILGLTGFYREVNAEPPRFIFLVAPGVLLTVVMFLTSKGRRFLDSVQLGRITLLHTARIPVEVVLYHLYAAALVPQIMTFEGLNFDIITGLTAPVIFFLVFKSKTLGAGWLLAWNIMGLGFLFTIMFIAILSSPTPFQQFAFEQPNTGVTYFPFVWLPGIIVPAALFAHLVSIRQLLMNTGKKSKPVKLQFQAKI